MENAARRVIDSDRVELPAKRRCLDAPGTDRLCDSKLRAADRGVDPHLVDLSDAKHESTAELLVEVTDGRFEPVVLVTEPKFRGVHDAAATASQRGAEVRLKLFAEVVLKRKVVTTKPLTNQPLNVTSVERVVKNRTVETESERKFAIKRSNLQTVEPIAVVVIHALQWRKRRVLRVDRRSVGFFGSIGGVFRLTK